jgi:hypothetical protein
MGVFQRKNSHEVTQACPPLPIENMGILPLVYPFSLSIENMGILSFNLWCAPIFAVL